MKKLILLLFIAILFQTASVAQIFNTLELNGGLYSGKPFHEKNIGILTNEPFKDGFTSKVGFSSEAIVYSKASKRIAFGTGIRFVQINYKHDVGNILTSEDLMNGTVTHIKNTVILHNIGIPMVCKFEMLKNKQLLQVIGGLGFYRVVESISENEVTGAGINDPILRAYQIENISKKYNLSTQLGLRALIKIKDNHAISIGCRAEYFLVQDKYYENGQGNILGLSATIGYVFESIE